MKNTFSKVSVPLQGISIVKFSGEGSLGRYNRICESSAIFSLHPLKYRDISLKITFSKLRGVSKAALPVNTRNQPFGHDRNTSLLYFRRHKNVGRNFGTKRVTTSGQGLCDVNTGISQKFAQKSKYFLLDCEESSNNMK